MKLTGIFVLTGCLFVTGYPDTTTLEPPVPEKTGRHSPEVTAALALLEKNGGTYEENADGAMIAVSLYWKGADDTERNDDPTNSGTELFDAINKLADLEKFTFEGPGIDDSCILRLTNLKNVKTANFKNTNITIASIEMMAETMKELTELSVNRCLNLDGKSLAVEGDVLRYVAEIPNLKVLRLKGADASFRDSSIRSLAGHPALRAFFLQDSNVSDDCLNSLMQIPTLIDLSLFRLLEISNDGMQKLEGSPLQRLFIRVNDNIDDEGIAVLKTMPDLDRLILYELSGVTDAGLIEALTNNTKLRSLAIFDMGTITDKSNDILKKATLRSLELRKTGHTDEVLKLASLLPRLETLIIGDNSKFTDQGLASLGASKLLKTVEIRNSTGITKAAIREFQTKSSIPRSHSSSVPRNNMIKEL